MNLSQPRMYMMVGLPASGKSTYIKNNQEFKDFTILSSDNYIDTKAQEENKTYNEVFAKYSKQAWKNLVVNLNEAISCNCSIVWDQTNLDSKSRIKKLGMVPEYYRKIAVVFNTPNEDVWQNRLSSRPGKIIPDYVLSNMKERFEVPTYNEGWHEIIFI